jgi:hypothetical protein
MSKDKRSCIYANYPETSMKVTSCYDGEVVMQRYQATKKQSFVSISVKGDANGKRAHQIFTNEAALELEVLYGSGSIQVEGGKKLPLVEEETYSVPANSWVKIWAAPFAVLGGEGTKDASMGEDDDGECEGD